MALADGYSRYGYRRVTALRKNESWAAGKDRVQRIWRREGLKVLKKQPRKKVPEISFQGAEKPSTKS